MLYFSRQRKKFHFFLYETSYKIIGKITEECAPFSVGDTFKIHKGDFKGEYEIKNINSYSNVVCRLKNNVVYELKNSELSEEALEFLKEKH